MEIVRWGIAALLLSACSFSAGANGDDGNADTPNNPTLPPDAEVLTMSGTIVDFVTGEPVTDVTALEGVDLSDGDITVDGSTFTITGMVPFSIFRLKATSPTHEVTISGLLAIDDVDVTDAVIEVVPTALIDEAYDTTFRGRRDGVIVARLVDGNTGEPMTGVAEGAFPVGDVIRFLDASWAVSRDAPISLDPGIALLLNVEPGLITLESQLPEHLFLSPKVRVEGSVVTLVDIDVGLEPPPLPMDVAFDPDVVGVFDSRGCAFCHRDTLLWNPPNGFDLGGTTDERYDQVMNGRVVVMDPDASLLLRKPSFEEADDNHQIVFENEYDPDSMILQAWILDGALR